jgi:Sigma-70, region 4
MTPADEQVFIRLWQQGATQQELAQRLGVPVGTVRSRAYSLQQQGKISHRPRGGRRMPASKDGSPAPVQRAVQSGAEQPVMHGAQSVQNSAVHTPMHGAEPVQNSAEPPIPAALAVEFGRLWAAIDALQRDVHRPVHDTVQSLPEPLFDDPADNTTERWNLYLKRGLRVRIEALAQARGIAPSRVVQEILWQALNDQSPATP